jgi:hypothetical protein
VVPEAVRYILGVISDGIADAGPLWIGILAYITGMGTKELATWNEYLAAQDLILKAQLKRRLKPSVAERTTLGEIGPRQDRKVRAGCCCTVGRCAGYSGRDGALPVFREHVVQA